MDNSNNSNPYNSKKPDIAPAYYLKFHSPMLTAWNAFITQLEKPDITEFPHEQIRKFLQTSGSSTTLVTLRQLLEIVPHVYQNYQQNCDSYKQIILLLYIIICKKGCTSKAIFSIAINILQNMLRYRILLLCSNKHGKSLIFEVYIYIKNWLEEFIPKVLQYEQDLLIQMFRKLYKQEKSDNKILQRSSTSASIDQVLIIFEVLLIKKVIYNLCDESLQQFEEFLKELLDKSKFDFLKYCIQKGKEKNSDKEGIIVDLHDLAPIREDQEKCEIYDLLVHRSQQKNSAQIIVEKIKNKQKIQQWVIDSYLPGKKPIPVDVSPQRLKKMKSLQLYRFFCMLQIYGSSPNIDILDQYIPNQQFLEFFSLFLMGQNLCQQQYKYGNQSIKQILDLLADKTKNLQKIHLNVILGEIQMMVKDKL